MLNLFQHLTHVHFVQSREDFVRIMHVRHAELISASLFLIMEKGGAVYIMMNKINTVIYIGVTANLLRRVIEHKENKRQGFTSKYNCTKLVYFELHSRIEDAITREKSLKNWRRTWKLNLIREGNPSFNDLSGSIVSEW